jgi:putative transcriptional regulator
VSQDGGGGPIQVRLDELLAERGLTLTELADRVGITIVNLSVLKNGRARAIRFSTLAALCAALGCQPGDLLGYQPGELPDGAGPPPGFAAGRVSPGPARAPRAGGA